MSVKSNAIRSSQNEDAQLGVLAELAHFRYALRTFLRFSENAARACGVTPQQHQLMLGVAGFTGRNSATISELAEFLQERNHSVVGLVERAMQSGLVKREQDASDRRVVVVTLTKRGQTILSKLAALHKDEIRRIPPVWRAETKKRPRAAELGSAADHSPEKRGKSGIGLSS